MNPVASIVPALAKAAIGQAGGAAGAGLFGVRADGVWLAIGLVSQAVVAACLLAEYLSARAGRKGLPVAIPQFALLATLVLVVYSVLRGDPVFVVGQVVNVLVCWRLLHLARKAQRKGREPVLPRVAPDSAERRLTQAPPRTPPPAPREDKPARAS